MALSSPNKIYDPIRSCYLVSTPEERVRQDFILKLLENGYPKHLIQVEVALKQATDQKKLPNRRADIVCFAKTIETYAPFLLIECKGVKITKATFRQIMGYNYFIGAKHLCVVNQKEVFFGIENQDKEIQFQKRFFSFEQLLRL